MILDADTTGYDFGFPTTGHLVVLLRFRDHFAVLQAFHRRFSLEDWLRAVAVDGEKGPSEAEKDFWLTQQEARSVLGEMKSFAFAHASEPTKGLEALRKLTKGLISDARTDQKFATRDGFNEGRSLAAKELEVDVRGFLQSGQDLLRVWHEEIRTRL